MIAEGLARSYIRWLGDASPSCTTSKHLTQLGPVRLRFGASPLYPRSRARPTALVAPWLAMQGCLWLHISSVRGLKQSTDDFFNGKAFAFGRPAFKDRHELAGKVVASIKNGTRVDALGWDPSKKLIYIPNGGEGNVTVVHQDSPDKYTVVDTVSTFPGAKTICVDTKTHNVYLFQPERGPAPASAAGAAPPAGPGGRGRGPQGPIVAAWFIVIKQ